MIKYISIILFIFTFSHSTFAEPQYSSEPQNRPRIELNGAWLKERVIANHYLSVLPRTKKTITKIEKESKGRCLSNYNDKPWKEQNIPAVENPVPDRYEGGVWYRRKFTIPQDFKGKHLRLQFEAVNYIADVWINGKWIGSHEGGYTPFSFDITKYINFSAENTIAVRVDNIPWIPIDSKKSPIYKGNDIVPYKTCDWWNYGGITRNVFIEVCEPISISNVHITKGNAKITLFNHLEKENKITLKTKIWSTKITDENITNPKADSIIDRTKYINGESVEITFYAGKETKEINLTIPVNNLSLWSPKNPILYVLELSLSNGDTYYTQFGIRNIEVKAGRIFLNNNLLHLNGVARHEVFGASERYIYNDLKIIKEMNANFLRTAHYPNETELYILTDRMGILVWEEIPVYWCDEEGFNNQAKRKIADQMWREMIERDINRPSIIFWGTCNECFTQKERREFLKRLYDIAYSLDGTRLVAQSANGREPMDKTHEVCDIIGVTMYYGIFYGKDYYKDTLNAIEAMHSIFPEKPILITEYGIWSGLDMSLSQNQIKLAHDNLKAFLQKPYIIGWTWWCAFDWYTFITTFQTMGAITQNRDYYKPIYYYLQKAYGNKFSPLEVEIHEPHNYAVLRGIAEIKTKIKSTYKIDEAVLLINNQKVNPYFYKWDTTQFPDGEYGIKLFAKDNAGVTQTAMKKVFIDNIDNPPDITINIDNGQAIMHYKDIEIKLTDDRSPPMDLSASLSIDGQEVELKSNNTGKFYYRWDLNNYKNNSTHSLIIKANDSGNNTSEKTLDIIADNTPGIYVRLPYNHDWISSQENMSDGTGWDFPAEEMPETNLDFISGQTKLMFGDKSDGKTNNVECQGQKIGIEADNYNNLFILASSHDGSTNEKIKLIYDDNTEEGINMAISDWWGARPMFREEVAIKCTHHHERNAKDNQPGAGIYLVKIPLNTQKKLKSIILPDNQKLHIFAMTLDKRRD